VKNKNHWVQAAEYDKLLVEVKKLRAVISRTHDLIKQGRYHAADAELEDVKQL